VTTRCMFMLHRCHWIPAVCCAMTVTSRATP
jgi:hypothetical protein